VPPAATAAAATPAGRRRLLPRSGGVGPLSPVVGSQPGQEGRAAAGPAAAPAAAPACCGDPATAATAAAGAAVADAAGDAPVIVIVSDGEEAAGDSPAPSDWSEEGGGAEEGSSSSSDGGGGAGSASPSASPSSDGWTPTRRAENDPPAPPGGRPLLPAIITTATLAAPAAPAAAAAFRRARARRAAELYAAFNAAAWGGRLPADLAIAWSTRLRTTAGLTHFGRLPRGALLVSAGTAGPPPHGGRTARIELSVKVVDGDGRLAATLLHEMCHVAAWLLDGVARPPHGPTFKAHAASASAALPSVPPVTTCHGYRVHAPHAWRCVGRVGEGGGGGGAAATAAAAAPPAGGCGREYRRHSASIDPTRHACGVCRGRLVYLGKDGEAPGGGDAGATPPTTKRPPTRFARFVSSRFADARAAAPPGTPPSTLMRLLGEQYRAEMAAGSVAQH